MLEMRRLQALHAVVETGSVKAAAAQLGYSSSGISQHITSLEREVGTALLEPAGRGIRPTAAGHLLAEHASGLLARLTAAENELAALKAGELGELRMASFATAGAELVPAALAAVHQALPALEITLRLSEREEAIELLRSGMIDLAVVETHNNLGTPGDDLLAVSLMSDPFRVVMPSTHPLADKTTIELSELADESWIDIACEIGCCRDATTAAFNTAGFTPHRVVQADDYWPAQGFVAAGIGLALLPSLALSIQHHGVAICELRHRDRPQRHVIALTRRGIASNLPVASMASALKAHAADGADARQAHDESRHV